jgi:hypothetical protein
MKMEGHYRRDDLPGLKSTRQAAPESDLDDIGGSGFLCARDALQG